MLVNSLRQINLSLLIFFLLILVSQERVQATEPFSFDRAFQIYHDTHTASQLLDYLKNASPNDQKDYRFTLYQIRAYYAINHFAEGDALVETGLSLAGKAALSDSDVQKIRADLQSERSFWVSQFELKPLPSATQSAEIVTSSHARSQGTPRDDGYMTHAKSGGKSTAKKPNDQ